jgi:hypothetical protein
MGSAAAPWCPCGCSASDRQKVRSLLTISNQKLEVLIDADNAQASVSQELLAEVSRYGTATIKRAYGD